jgi:hypothetical protein
VSAPIAEKPRHIHYCKDYRDKTGEICLGRSYCECECGSRAKIVSSDFQGGRPQAEWVTAVEWEAKEAKA